MVATDKYQQFPTWLSIANSKLQQLAVNFFRLLHFQKMALQMVNWNLFVVTNF